MQSCVSCGAYTLDQLTLERLLGGPSSHWGATPDPGAYLGTPPGGSPVYAGAPTIPAPPPPPPALPGELPPPMVGQAVPTYRPTPLPPLRQTIGEPQLGPDPTLASPYPEADAQAALDLAARQSQTRMILAIGVFAVLGVVMVLGAILAFQGLNTYWLTNDRTETVPSADLNDVLSDEPRSTSATGGQVTAEPPEPEPKPKPEPKRPAPKVDPTAAALAAGWNNVDNNPSAALQSFQRVLDRNASHPEANYGYGYAKIKLGDAAGAKPYLCTALAGAGVETQRDVTSILASNGLSCD